MIAKPKLTWDLVKIELLDTFDDPDEAAKAYMVFENLTKDDLSITYKLVCSEDRIPLTDINLINS